MQKMNLSLTDETKRPIWQLGLFIMAFIVTILISNRFMFENAAEKFTWYADEIKISESDEYAFATKAFDDAGWHSIRLKNVVASAQPFWIRTQFNYQSDAFNHPPYALYLSGLFSAEVFLDGQKLFEKGRVENSTLAELSGPIDSVVYLPEYLMTPGEHLLALRLSSANIGYQTAGIFHLFGIAQYNRDARRTLRYYAIPLVVSSGLFLLVLQFFRILRSTGSKEILWLCLATIFNMLQLTAEVSRSFIAYSYQYHMLRSLMIWLFCFASLTSLLMWLNNRIQNVHFSYIVYSLIVLAMISSYFSQGFDNKTVSTIQIMAIAPLIAAGFSLRRRLFDLMIASAAVTASGWIIFSIYSGVFLLDSVFYATYLAFFFMLLICLSSDTVPKDSGKAEFSDQSFISVKLAGKLTRIAVQEILYIKADGNFTELHCVDGKALFHHQRLGQIMEKPPKNFLRVHRSFALNMQYVESLKSSEGSRYVALISGQSIPVSRYRVAEFKRIFTAKVWV